MERQNLLHREPIGVLLGGPGAALPDRTYRRQPDKCVLLHASERSSQVCDAADRQYDLSRPDATSR